MFGMLATAQSDTCLFLNFFIKTCLVFFEARSVRIALIRNLSGRHMAAVLFYALTLFLSDTLSYSEYTYNKWALEKQYDLFM